MLMILLPKMASKKWHTQVFNNELYLQNESVTRQDTNQSILEFTGLQK